MTATTTATRRFMILILLFVLVMTTAQYVRLHPTHHDRVREAFSNLAIMPSNSELQYQNTNDDASGRAPIQDSLPIDSVVKYKNAYYYEFDNETYKKGLLATFDTTVAKYDPAEWNTYTMGSGPGTASASTTPAPPPDVLSAYDRCIARFTADLNRSKSLALPDDNHTVIQVVHDVLIRYRTSIKRPKQLYSFDIEAILYRESKFQGKHIAFRAIYNVRANILYITNIAVLGAVSEDQIGMFPVYASNPYEVTELTAAATAYPAIIPAADYSLISDKNNHQYWQVTGYDQATIATLQKRANLAVADANTTAAVAVPATARL